MSAEAETGLVVPPSRGNAIILAALGAALVSVAVYMAPEPWDRGPVWALVYAPVVGAISLALLTAAMGLAMRSKPAFAVDGEAIWMPYGMLGLARLSWSEIEGWGMVERRIPWLPFLTQRVFAVWLGDRSRFPRIVRQEIRLNRMVAGADLIVSDWFLPNGFGLILATCRQIRPDLERIR